MKEHEPELFEKIAKIMLPKDYLASLAVRYFCMNIRTHQGMLLLDVQNKCWSKRCWISVESESSCCQAKAMKWLVI